jgi:hypothetical protein
MNESPILTKSVIGSGGNVYRVCLYETFETCTCKGFQHRQKCKHSQAVREEFLNDISEMK